MNTFLLGALLLLVSCGSGSGSGNQDPNISPSLITTETAVNSFMELINDHRASLGLRPLTHDRNLGTIAETHSLNMAKAIVPFGHTGFSERCSSSRAALGGGNWCAENVAQGQKTIKDAFTAWMNSSGHRTNIESSRATHTGFGFAKSSGGTLYWTQIFIER